MKKLLFCAITLSLATIAQMGLVDRPAYGTSAGITIIRSDPDVDQPPCPQTRKLEGKISYGSYEIRAYGDTPDLDTCLQILKSGAVVYSRVSRGFTIGRSADNETDPGVPIGTDVTGLGKPDAVVWEWSGGAHCCFDVHVFELGDIFREVGQIDAQDGDLDKFVDLNHDGHFEFEGYDFTFAYWRTSFAFSPAPRVVLTYRDNAFRPAIQIMKKPEPTPEEFSAMMKEVRGDEDWNPAALQTAACGEDTVAGGSCGVPVKLWSDMLDLMYAGHSDKTWELLDETWPQAMRGKADFSGQFCEKLRSSIYWSDLEATLEPCPPQRDSKR